MYGEQTTITFARTQATAPEPRRTPGQIAKDYLLKEENPRRVQVVLYGERRTLFVNNRERGCPVFGLLNKRARRRGRAVYADEWEKIEKVIMPEQKRRSGEEESARLLLKYKKAASLATHTSEWLRDIRDADMGKSLYENRVTMGCQGLDGTSVKVSTIAKWCGQERVDAFMEAVRKGEKYNSGRFNFQGYDGTLWVFPSANGDVNAGFSKEYRNCGNGYYYLLANDDTFMFYSKG